MKTLLQRRKRYCHYWHLQRLLLIFICFLIFIVVLFNRLKIIDGDNGIVSEDGDREPWRVASGGELLLGYELANWWMGWCRWLINFLGVEFWIGIFVILIWFCASGALGGREWEFGVCRSLINSISSELNFESIFLLFWFDGLLER